MVAWFLAVLLWPSVTGLEGQLARGEDCRAGQGNIFSFRVNFHTSGLMGEFQVAGCEGTSPTLLLTRGVEYTLLQEDSTNWQHPLGLSYYPDGAHGFLNYAEVPELEQPTPDTCDEEQFLCNPGPGVAQAPLYGIDGEFETFSDWNNGSSGGLDVYEPSFQVPQDQWAEHRYAVRISVPLESRTQSLFYFCHIHRGMSGPMRVEDPVSNPNLLVQPWQPHNYYIRQQQFDIDCGTSQVSQYHQSRDQFCPNMSFLCEQDDNPVFSACMEAIDCKMNYEMRVEEHRNPLVVFMHQMIPHHQNAVNMARIALKHAAAAEGFDDSELSVPALLRDIINTQNKQIQDMEGWLDRYGHGTPKLCPSPQAIRPSDIGAGPLSQAMKPGQQATSPSSSVAAPAGHYCMCLLALAVGTAWHIGPVL